MPARLWFILRLSIIASFSASGFDTELTKDDLSVPPIVFVIIRASIPLVAVIQYAGLNTVRRSPRPSHDWNASLWFSPLLRNPQSFMLTGALAMIAFGLSVTINHLVFSGCNPVIACAALSMGLGTLAGLLAFRRRHLKIQASC